MKTLADETGETLVELMITILIMAVGMTAVVAALSMTIKGSDLHHSLAQGEVMVRDYGEAIKDKAMQDPSDPDYVECPEEGDLDPTDFDDGTTPVAGEGDAWVVDITKVEYWVPGTRNPAGFTESRSVCLAAYTPCEDLVDPDFTNSCDPGYQRVTYVVSNARTDYAETAIEGQVLTRRNNVVEVP